MSYTIGAVAIESSLLARADAGAAEEKGETLRRLRARFELAPAGRYPNVVASSAQLARFASEEQFRAGLTRILASRS